MENPKLEPPAQRASRLKIEYAAVSDVWCDWKGKSAPYPASESEIETSKAISLKRIADALEPIARLASMLDTWEGSLMVRYTK